MYKLLDDVVYKCLRLLIKKKSASLMKKKKKKIAFAKQVSNDNLHAIIFPLTVRGIGKNRVGKEVACSLIITFTRTINFIWCCIFLLCDDMELDTHLWTETDITLVVDCRQEFLETCRIFLRLWRRHKWLSKLRQYVCKRNLLRRAYVLHLLHLNFYCFSIWISHFLFFYHLFCRAEFDGYCEGELIKVSLSLSECVVPCAC